MPVIDISDLRGGDPVRRRDVGSEIRAACVDRGFMYIVGHGVPERLIDEVFAASRDFFALPLTAKAQYDAQNAIARRGYFGVRTQAFEGGPADLKESYFYGVELPPEDPRVVRRLYDHGPNQWPAELPGFRPVMEAYLAEMLALNGYLLDGLALSLGLPETYFDAFKRQPMCPVRLLYYPPPDPGGAEGENSFGAHTDFGALTVLAQDASGGFQIQADDGRWIDVPPVPGSFIVNLGDFVQRWTNDLYRSTRHRVVSNGGHRYSVAAFYNGNPECAVECIPECVAPGETARYEPTTMVDYLQMRVREISAATY